MDLQQLKADRGARELAPLPISEQELCDRYEATFTAAVNDVLRERGLLYQVLPTGIMPLRDDMKVCGIGGRGYVADVITFIAAMSPRIVVHEINFESFAFFK